MRRETVMAGFAIFAMFFGSGNIVFPLALGRISGDVWLFSVLGFFLTAVIVPLLGLLAVVLLQGSSNRFFGLAGKIPGSLIQLFIIALLGPLGVIPRCIGVSYGAIKTLEISIPETAFIALFCICLWFLTARRGQIIPIIGKYLTPVKLTLITLLIALGIYMAPPITPLSCKAFDIFTNGIREGYQTMDLTAAIFFSAAIMSFFRSVEGDTPTALLKDGVQASLIGATLLTAVYISFVYLGSAYANLTCNVPPEQILPTIAHHALGKSAGIVFCITIVFSCLTTAVALVSCWLDGIKNLNIFPNAPYPLQLGISLLIAFGMASLGFSGIVKFLAPLLELVYPLLIVMVVVHLIRELRRLPAASKETL